MLVLEIIGGILGLIFLYWVVEKMNEVSYRDSKYEYFSSTTAGFTIVGYYFLFFGNSMYQTASHAVNGDILNGILIMIIGGILVSVTVLGNFTNEKEHLFRAIFFTMIQLTIYVGLAFIGIFIVLIAFAALSQTKPVLVLNND